MSAEENADYHVDIVDARLKVCCVKVAPSAQLAHAEVLKKTSGSLSIQLVSC